jgi:predicted MFS family arabinose efflux permease
MIGDVIPPERRGTAMSFVMTSFAVASVLGIPAGLLLADKFGWHAPFFMLASLAAINLVIGSLALPHIKTAVHDHQPWRQMREILSHGVHLRAFAVGAVLVMAGGCLVPFIAPSMVVNVGLTQSQLAWAYGAGGFCSIISMPIIGRLSDRVDKLRLLAIMSAAAIVVVLVLTRLGPASLTVACLVMALFMVTMSSRFTPAMAMVTNAVEARYRGGFMSVNAALQQAASGLANVIAGIFVTTDAAGHLLGYPTLGYAAIGFFVLTVLLAAELRAAAPHVSAPKKNPAVPLEPIEAAL